MMNVTVINSMMFNSLKVVLIFWLFVNYDGLSYLDFWGETQIFCSDDLLYVIDQPDQFLPW